MATLRERDSLSARALEFTVLTAARTSETVGADWDEFDLDAGVWTVPAERMKAGRQHRVPLSDRAIQILREQRFSGGTFLPPEVGSTPHVVRMDQLKNARPFKLSNMGMLQLLRGMRPGLTVHGFRSSFRDWAAECTNYQNHIAEMALAHTISDKAEKSYRRGDLFEKRRRLMDAWAGYCHAPVSGTVVSFRSQSDA
jgi:integrase